MNTATCDTSATAMDGLCLELLDSILESCYLLWVRRRDRFREMADKDVTERLMLVSSNWNLRISRGKFKKALCRRIAEYYERTQPRTNLKILKNNQRFLLEFIQPDDSLIDRLTKVNCLTKEKAEFIKKLRRNRDRNFEILNQFGPFDEARCRLFRRCLKGADQPLVSSVMDYGGIVVSVTSRQRKPKQEPRRTQESKPSLDSDLQSTIALVDCLNRMVSFELTRGDPKKSAVLIDHNSRPGRTKVDDRPGQSKLIACIWLKTETAFQELKSWIRSDFDSAKRYFGLVAPSSLSFDRSQFEKDFVIHSEIVKFQTRFDLPRTEKIWGLAQLQGKIHVLSCDRYVIEGTEPTLRDHRIILERTGYPADLGPSEVDACLYVTYPEENFILKIKDEEDANHQVIQNATRWIETGKEFRPSTLSVCAEGELIVVDRDKPCLRIYGRDGVIRVSVQLPKEFVRVHHAVRNSKGHFIISHLSRFKKQITTVKTETAVVQEPEKAQPDDVLSSERSQSNNEQHLHGDESLFEALDVMGYECGVSEVSADGQTVIHRYSLGPVEDEGRADASYYLCVDSDDQVYVAAWDLGIERLFQLDFDLQWRRDIHPERDIPAFGLNANRVPLYNPRRVIYDERRKQLTVGGGLDDQCRVYIYTFHKHSARTAVGFRSKTPDKSLRQAFLNQTRVKHVSVQTSVNRKIPAAVSDDDEFSFFQHMLHWD